MRPDSNQPSYAGRAADCFDARVRPVIESLRGEILPGVDEIKFALEKNRAAESREGAEKKAPVTFIPFLLGDRTRPHVEINEQHHKRLDADPQTNAATVADRVIKVLLGGPLS